DVLEAGLKICPQHARQAAELLAPPRVALVRHRARALLRALAERLLDLAHLGALEMADLESEALDRRADRRARVEELGVPVAGNHLARRRRCQPQLLTDERLDLGVDVRIGPDDAGQ